MKIDKNKTTQILEKAITGFLVICSIVSVIQLVKYAFIDNQGQNYIKLEPEKQMKLLANITGAVKSPGEYEIDGSMRILDLVEKAGGFSTNADLTKISSQMDLSKKVVNGEVIVIPIVVEDESEELTDEIDDKNGKIDINTASIGELDSLPGIGPKTAELIVEARPFVSIDQIKDVKGIGESSFEKIKDLIIVE